MHAPLYIPHYDKTSSKVDHLGKTVAGSDENEE